MFDVDMDCSKTVNGWFLLKVYIKKGQGWEGDTQQSNTPYSSNNHFAQCGKINKFDSNNSNVEIRSFK
jgi:alpha-amylase